MLSSAAAQGKRITVYINGDPYMDGRTITLNTHYTPEFDTFCQYLTEHIPHKTGGCYRRVYTPNGTEIRALKEFEAGHKYVASKSKYNRSTWKIGYREIPERQRLTRLKGFKKIDISKIYQPVQHAAEERLRKKSGRSYYLNEHRRGLRLRVHVNGQSERPYCPVSIQYRDKENWGKILEEIERTLHLQPVKQVFKIINQGGMVENFQPISQAEHVDPDDHILVLPKNDKRLQVKVYSLEGKNNFKVATSPRAGQYYLYPAFPTENNGKHNKSLNKHRPLPSIGSTSSKQSDAMSPFSNPPQSQAGRKNHSVKSKGSHRQVDYDQDSGGVYRAKKQNHSRGAQQVNDTRDTYTERPIDQMEAEVVEEGDTVNIPDSVKSAKRRHSEMPEGRRDSHVPAARRHSEMPGGRRDSNESTETKRCHSNNPPTDSQVPTATNRRHSDMKKSDPPVPTATKRRHSDMPSRNEPEVPIPTGRRHSDMPGGRRATTERRLSEVLSQTKDSQDRTAEESAATKIQAGVKGHIARKEYRKQKEEKARSSQKEKENQAREDQRKSKEMSEDQAASKIQASFKGYQTRKDISVKKQQVRQDKFKRDKEIKEQEAATHIQSGFKGYKARKEYAEKRKSKANNKVVEETKGTDINDNEKGNNDKDQADAALKIQSGYRGYKTRREFNAKKEAQKAQAKSMSDDKAASKIQAGFKGYKTRKDYSQKRAAGPKKGESDGPVDTGADKELDQAASRIQANFKGYKVRKEHNAAKKRKVDEDKAASKIQASFKGYRTRKDIAKEKNVRATDTKTDDANQAGKNAEEELEQAATKIQSGFRGYQARKEFKSKGQK